ncbi:MAG: acyl-CoA dehydrogenase family protein [Halioglobus sp.]
MSAVTTSDTLLLDSAERLFGDHCDQSTLDQAAAGHFPEALWQAIVTNGFHQVARQDSGVALSDAFHLLRVAARCGVPLPLAEALLAARWLDSESDDFLAIGAVGTDGRATIPWGQRASRCLVLTRQNTLCTLDTAAASHTANLAGEPCAILDAAQQAALTTGDNPLLMLALARAACTAGALEKTLALSLRYVQERHQFGRPIASFQAIQHTLAVMAAEVAAASQATDAAIAMLQQPRLEFEIAAARIRCAEASTLVAEAAHQVHGAIGFTQEHSLQHFTRRLWAWRDDYGSEQHWQQVLGRHLCELGAADADNIWDFIATGY